MGAGKTSVGKALSRMSSLPFIDTDLYLEAMEGRTIPEIFAEEGEAYFREEESKVIDKLLHFPEAIIATGGGMPCHANNMDKLNQLGHTVYLKVSNELLVNRLLPERESRPLLAGKTQNQINEIVMRMLKDREPSYVKAKTCFEVQENHSTEDISREILLRRQFDWA